MHAMLRRLDRCDNPREDPASDDVKFLTKKKRRVWPLYVLGYFALACLVGCLRVCAILKEANDRINANNRRIERIVNRPPMEPARRDPSAPEVGPGDRPVRTPAKTMKVPGSYSVASPPTYKEQVLPGQTAGTPPRGTGAVAVTWDEAPPSYEAAIEQP